MTSPWPKDPAVISPDPEYRKTMLVYAGLVIALVMSFVPHAAFSAAAMGTFVCVLILAYVFKMRAARGGLLENHMIFLIRSLWITGLWAGLSLIAGILWMLARLEFSALNTCAENLLWSVDLQRSGMDALLDLAHRCEAEMQMFMTQNMSALVGATFIAALPPVVYLIYRLSKGLNRAARAYRLSSPKAWF